MKTDNITSVLAKFTKQLNLPINIQDIYDELLIHPDYPSLLAISDVLTNFDIENGAFRVDDTELANVPCPFIAHTNINSGDFVIVDKIDGENVFVTNEKWNRHKLRADEFKKTFAGVVLSAKPTASTSGLFNLTEIWVTAKVPLVLAGLAVTLILALVFHTDYFINLSWESLLLTVFKSAGLIISVLLLIQSIDGNNPLVQKLCQRNSKINCKAILSSKAAQVFKWLTWSEVGFFYFTATWLLLLFGGGSRAIWQILALLNFMSLPYTIYSIYYQARIAKQWCVLCCTVQALLWLEFIPLIINFLKTSPLISGRDLEGAYGTELCTLLIALLLPVIFWVLLKPMLLQLQQLHPLKQQLNKIKYNTELFSKILAGQPKFVQPDENWSIVMGNVEAENIITMVTNPYCPPCAQAHKLLHNLLKQNYNLQARIVFTANNTDDDIKTPVTRHLMSLHGLSDKTIVKKALYDWYEQKQKDYKTWAKVYPVELNENEYNKINKQKAWCEMAEVTATPTMLLNGYKMPDLYQLTDLKYMLQ